LQMIGISALPAGSSLKCYISLASRRKGSTPTFLLQCMSPFMTEAV
jgi:hypothetical protein